MNAFEIYFFYFSLRDFHFSRRERKIFPLFAVLLHAIRIRATTISDLTCSSFSLSVKENRSRRRLACFCSFLQCLRVKSGGKKRPLLCPDCHLLFVPCKQQRLSSLQEADLSSVREGESLLISAVVVQL